MRRSFIARHLLPPMLLLAVIAVTFSSTLHNQFVNWDDQSEITENEHFNPVTGQSLAWNWSNTQLTLYMPITYMVWGGVANFASRDSHGILQPIAFHGLNIILHLVCSTLVYFLLLRLWKSNVPALAGALLFAVHPLQVEAVAWASGMYTLLSTAFSLAAIIAYISAFKSTADAGSEVLPRGGSCAGESSDERSASSAYLSAGVSHRLYWLATFFYVLALLSKAASVSVPLAAMLIDVLILHRPLRKSIRSLSLWILLSIPVVLVAKMFQDVSVIAVPPLWGRPFVALDAMGFYIRKIVLPLRLFPDYGRNPTWVMQHPMPAFISGAIAVVALLAAYAARHRAGWITAGVGILLAGVGPYLGLTPFDFQYVSTVADRYAYFGLVGGGLLTAGVVMRWRWAAPLFVVAAILCIVISRAQVARWHDTDTLFAYTLRENPQSLVSHGVFGFLAAGRGDFSTAETDYLQSLKVWPEDTKIHFNLGNLYSKQARVQKSHPVEYEKLMSQALEHYELAVKFQPKMTIYRNSLAAAFAELGQFDPAYAQWQEVKRRDPLYVEARNNLADMLMRHGNIDEAKQEYRAILRVAPYNQHARESLGK